MKGSVVGKLLRIVCIGRLIMLLDKRKIQFRIRRILSKQNKNVKEFVRFYHGPVSFNVSFKCII